jgi:small-conductance mechanosensitive channel
MPSLFIAIVIFVFAYVVDRAQRRFFGRVEAGRIVFGSVDRDTAPPTRRLATIAIWLFAAVMAYPYIPGSDTDAFKGLSVLLGIMVSVGASGIVGQATSGFILMYTRTFRTGEYVRIGDREGTMTRLGMFTSTIRTGLGEELTMPNTQVLASMTTNYSRVVPGPGFMLAARVSIGYDTPWRQVHAMLLEAACSTDGVLADPPPHVFQTSLDDFYVQYRLVCQASPTDPFERAKVVSSLNAAIQDAFNAHGVQIMSPHYMVDPAAAKVVPPARWYTPPARRDADDTAGGSAG